MTRSRREHAPATMTGSGKPGGSTQRGPAVYDSVYRASPGLIGTANLLRHGWEGCVRPIYERPEELSIARACPRGAPRDTLLVMPADRLRTLGVVAAALAALPGCPGPGRRPAASVDGASLSADRLAQLLVLAQPVPLRRDVAYELASHWVTLTAFARRMALGDSLLDSATIADMMSQRARRAKAVSVT